MEEALVPNSADVCVEEQFPNVRSKDTFLRVLLLVGDLSIVLGCGGT